MQNDNSQVDAKMLEYINQRYEGVLPKDFIKLFEKAIFHIPPSVHNMHVGSIREIRSSNNSQLLIRQVGACQSVIRSCPPNLIFNDIDEYLRVHEQIEKIHEKYKFDIMMKQREIDTERRGKANILAGNGLHKI